MTAAASRGRKRAPAHGGSAIAWLMVYDATLLRQLTAAEHDAVGWFALAAGAGCLWVAAPFGYAAWLALQNPVIALGVGASMAALVWAIVRLNVAGGGPRVAASLQQQGSYAGPVRVLGLVGLLAAQPAQLIVTGAETQPAIAQRRQALLDRYTQLTSLPLTAASPRQAQATAQSSYRAQLARCEFVALRLAAVWAQPSRAVRYSLFYWLLLILPCAAARALAAGALRRYERLRGREAERWVARDGAAMQRELARRLGDYASYVPVAERLRSPLRLPWPEPAPGVPEVGSGPRGSG